MTTLKFADTHNMVAFLSKPTESKGFEQIVDFLNAHPIKHALTVNPTIYTSCIKQLWATVKAKIVNGEVQLQAPIDGKKIIITKSTVRRDLQLKDVEGVDCLPNATIFEQLALMGYEQVSQKLSFYKAFFSPQWKFFIHTILQCLSPKTTAWNEFSSTMTSAIIFLATKQKFNFSKFIFESMVKNLDNVGKLLMYPRPKKKDTQVPQSSVPSNNVADEAIYKELDNSLVRVATTASSLEVEQDSGAKKPWGIQLLKLGLRMYLNFLMIHYSQETTKSTQANEIASFKRRVKKLKKKDRSRTHKLKRLYKVGLSARVESSRDEDSLGEDASKQGRRINDFDADEDITLFNEDSEIFDVDALVGEEVFVAEQSRNVVEEVVAVIDASSTILISAAIITDVEITFAQALAELKSAKPKADKDKGKGIVIEEPMVEQVKPMKRLEQMRLDEELAFKLQAEKKKKKGLPEKKLNKLKKPT
ncbi:hypothetical protein Tco_0840344 [Tanacetum coccineum]|uniref:Xylulose kinase-1 n=1 Tax=Tanacetum coccineum TaxID=301880 RepID=A0ABQ5AVS9_9ASTR